MIRLLCFLIAIVSISLRADEAPGAPGSAFSWTSAKKQGVGTSYEPYFSGPTATSQRTSRVWFTIAGGVVTEAYYPRVDQAQVRDSQILVTDGESFLVEEKNLPTTSFHRVSGSLGFVVVKTDPQNRFEIEKRVWVDSELDVLVQDLQIRRNVAGLKFYWLHNTAAANSMFDDSARTKPLRAGEDAGKFSSWQVLGSPQGFRKQSVGFVGQSDGYQDLVADFQLNEIFETATGGNVALTAELMVPETQGTTQVTLFTSFANTPVKAIEVSEQIKTVDVEASWARYNKEWRSYLATLSLPSSPDMDDVEKDLLENSVLVLKASEDKLFPGAGVASLSIPWGEDRIETSSGGPYGNGGYHLIWPRDLYHVANAFLAVDDTESARWALERLKEAQYDENDGVWEFGAPRNIAKDGSFPQNFWADGTIFWSGYQADQTAMPVLLAYRLWEKGVISLDSCWSLVERATKFLVKMGPWTHQERWEENHGISPNSAAYVISAVLAASELANVRGERELAEQWQQAADSWALKPYDNIDSWTFTSNGKLNSGSSDGRYYQRIDGGGVDRAQGGRTLFAAAWNPLEDLWIRIANTAGESQFRWESEVVDGGFLDLVRLGVRSALHENVLETLPEIDQHIRVETPRGMGFYRYRFDGYGENGRGRLWPHLTGERLHYELQSLLELGEFHDPQSEKRQKLRDAMRVYASMASDTAIYSEQVWDEGDEIGRPTGAATPLCWAHAEYVQLWRSWVEGAVYEGVPLVRDRYAYERVVQ